MAIQSPVLFDVLVDQVEAATMQAGGRTKLHEWIIGNTRHPLNRNKPWSFEEHEFQIDIVNCVHPRMYIRKASQEGVSEIMVRMVMALLAKLPGRHAIYTLPDASFARKFAPSRFDPVVGMSDRLKALRGDPFNNEIKRFGESYLYIGGANVESQAISVPASMMFNDEVAYSNPEVLGVYESRLGHLKEGEEIVCGFSTPLLEGSDIDALYKEGTRDTYAVFHYKCGQWVVLDPLKCLIVPGFDRELTEFTRIDLNSPGVSIEEAFVQCPHCKQPIAQDNLANPAARAWVSEFPGRYSRSFDANYLVLPAIKTPVKVLRARGNYRSTGKWLNFAIGVPADTSDARISEAALSRARVTRLVHRDYQAHFMMTTWGMDVGKVGHLIGLGLGSDAKTMHVFHADTPRQDGDNFLATHYAKLFNETQAIRGVIDAGPEFSVVTRAHRLLGAHRVFGCYFKRTDASSDLAFYAIKDEEGVVMVQRTRALNLFVDEFNRGLILLPVDSPLIGSIEDHLKKQARVTDSGTFNEELQRWVSTGEDHFFFALFYAWLAMKMMTETLQANRAILAVAATVERVRLPIIGETKTWRR